jgi:acetyl esterase/lipase
MFCTASGRRRTPDDGQGCGPLQSIPCDHVLSVSNPTITPFIVTNGTGASVVIAPGGGYHDLSWGKEGLDVARMYNSIGVSAFVLKYRVPARPDVPGLPHWWAPLQDAQRAIGIVRSKATEWGLNASMVGFTGFSAGGHLTAHISTAWETRYYARVDASDDASCKPDFSVFMYPGFLLPNNKPAPWGANYSLSEDFAGKVGADHPVSLFIQNQVGQIASPPCSLSDPLLSANTPPRSFYRWESTLERRVCIVLHLTV